MTAAALAFACGFVYDALLALYLRALAAGRAAQASAWSAAVGVTTLQGLEEALGHGPAVKAALVLGYGAGTFCAVTWSNRKKGTHP